MSKIYQFERPSFHSAWHQNRNSVSLKKVSSLDFQQYNHFKYYKICLCARMLILEWKERAFIEKVNSRCFCWFLAAILVHQNCTPIWRLHTKFYKGAWNVSANNSETVGRKDLKLGQIVYILVLYNISFSWLLPLDGFQLIFLLRDSENYLLLFCRFRWRHVRLCLLPIVVIQNFCYHGNVTSPIRRDSKRFSAALAELKKIAQITHIMRRRNLSRTGKINSADWARSSIPAANQTFSTNQTLFAADLVGKESPFHFKIVSQYLRRVNTFLTVSKLFCSSSSLWQHPVISV